MLTKKQLEERKLSIGGSDAAAALGLSPWKSAFQLWQEKTGVVTDGRDNSYMEWGRLLENAIAQKFTSDHSDRKYHLAPLSFVHPKHQWMTGSLDGMSEDKRVLEIKTARSAQDWGESGSQQIPQVYLLQIQHYMAVTAYPVADVAVLIGGSDYRTYEIPADAELQELIIEGEHRFWQKVQSNEPPAPDWESPQTRDVLKRVYPGTTGEILTADSTMEQWYGILTDAQEKAKSYEQVATGAMNHLLYTMKDAAVIKFTSGKELRRKLTKRKGYTVADTEFMDTRFVNSRSDT